MRVSPLYQGEVIVGAATQTRSVEFFFGASLPYERYGRAAHDERRSMNSGFDMWLQLGLSAVLLFAGLVALVAKRRVSKANLKMRDAAQATDSIRLMALAQQGQGKLDAALQSFLELPHTDGVVDDLFNLALEFEKAKQPKKAEAVLRQVQERKPGFRNVDRKLAQIREKVILAKVAAAKPAAPAKARFGAFEVEGELGKGAVGVVYLGQDPVIGREVAIKTLPLGPDSGVAEAAAAKARLFAGVRAAGGLSHPNIITIYDTGEERGAIYIAMELVKGGGLARFTAPGNLLPAETVVSIIARAADALGYAHQEGVVHLDVRAGNILYHAATDTVKLSDFGIGQAAGGDRRSDLLALGATLCQLLSGKSPDDVRDFEAEMPAGLGAVVARAVAANPDDRFQTGEEFSAALYAAHEAGMAQSAAVDIQL